MEEKDYRLVLIGNTQVGLIGLKEIFEELKKEKDKPEAEVRQTAGRRRWGRRITLPLL